MEDRQLRDAEESLLYPGFYVIPETPELFITKEGIVYYPAKDRIFDPELDRPNYAQIKVDGNSYSIHRLMALAFLKIPDGYTSSELDVNHMDGKKGNFRLENLEWATRKHNAQHAYDTGLRFDNRPILVKDIRSGVIARYNTLQECARGFKLNGAYIHQYVRPSNRGKVYQGHFQFIYEGDEWPEIDPNRKNGHVCQAVMITPLESIEDQTIYVFETVELVAAFFKVTGGAIKYWIKNRHGKPWRGYLLNYIDDLEIVDPAAKIIYRPEAGPRNRGKRPPVPIHVVNLATKEESDWPSVEAFGESVGFSKNTIQKGMWSNNGVWRNYYIEYTGKSATKK